MRGKLASLDFTKRTRRKKKPPASQKLNCQFHVYKNTETDDVGTVIPIIQIKTLSHTTDKKNKKKHTKTEGGGVTSSLPETASYLGTPLSALCAPNTTQNPCPEAPKGMGPQQEDCLG